MPEATEVAAITAALAHARVVAEEQDSPAFVSVEAGDYEVAEVDFSTFSGTGRALCKVNPDGGIDWEQLPQSFSERGNTILHDGDSGFVAWLNLAGGQRLEISYQPDNSPKLNIHTVTLTDKQLAEHINSECRGWTIDTLNVEGVRRQGDYVAD